MIIAIVGEDEGGQKRKLKNLAANLNLENKIEFLEKRYRQMFWNRLCKR